MNRQVRVRGVRRKEIDEDKLALAFMLLAKTLREQQEGDVNQGADVEKTAPADKPEAA
jgi:hypothetical protein